MTRASAATAQKQVQLDGVTQSLEKLKRKVGKENICVVATEVGETIFMS